MEPSVRLTRRTILRIGSLALAAPAAGILQALPGAPQTALSASAYVGRPVEDNAISIEGRPALEPR